MLWARQQHKSCGKAAKQKTPKIWHTIIRTHHSFSQFVFTCRTRGHIRTPTHTNRVKKRDDAQADAGDGLVRGRALHGCPATVYARGHAIHRWAEGGGVQIGSRNAQLFGAATEARHDFAYESDWGLQLPELGVWKNRGRGGQGKGERGGKGEGETNRTPLPAQKVPGLAQSTTPQNSMVRSATANRPAPPA